MPRTKQTRRKYDSEGNLIPEEDPGAQGQPSQPKPKEPAPKKRTGILNPEESRNYVFELGWMSDNFVSVMTRGEPRADLYREFVDSIIEKCTRASDNLKLANAATIIESVKDPSCRALRTIPAEKEDRPPFSKTKAKPVPEPDTVIETLLGLEAPFTKQARDTVQDIFNHLAESRSTEGMAFQQLATLARQVTPEQFMVVARLATQQHYAVTINTPAGQQEVTPSTSTVTPTTRLKTLREEVLPDPASRALRKVPDRHPTRIIAAVVAYRLTKSLSEETTMQEEAKRFTVRYNALSTALTIAQYAGRAPLPTSTAAKRKQPDDDDDDDDGNEEEEEEKQAREGPVEPRTQPDRVVKKKPRTEPSAAEGKAPPEEEPEDLPEPPV